MIIDTHSHMYWDSFQADLDSIIQRARDYGITGLINVGVDIPTSKQALQQTKELSETKGITARSSIGIHPHEAITYIEDQGKMLADVKRLEDLYRSDPQTIVGVGECGLDYFYESNPGWISEQIPNQEVKELQRQLLKMQVNLARNLDLPLIIHCRDAWDDIFDLVQGHYGLFHCYSGDTQITKKVLTTNFYISFAATITYPKNDYLRESAKMVPADRIVIETDCPFLPPQIKRGQRNEPSYIVETLRTLAEVRGEPREQLEQTIYQNTKTLFKF